MRIIVLQSSPNTDGLTAACAEAAKEGIRQAGGEVEQVRLNDIKLGFCQACNGGWGTCLKEHHCQVQDDFQALHERLKDADGLVLVTPVYWGEVSESAKAFIDRLRRCEATQDEGRSILSSKPVIAVAAAGGSGGGTITCLLGLERWIQHVQARVFDLIPVNRWGREYKLAAIRSAGNALVTELWQKEKQANYA